MPSACCYWEELKLANTKAAEKAIRQNERRRDRNRWFISRSRTYMKKTLKALDAGADDFIVEPVAADVLAARIRATTRRVVGRVQPFVEHGAVRVDPAARTVTSAGLPVPLTSKEFALLLELIEHAGQVMTRTRLEEALYSWGEQIGSNALEVHVFNLRRKLGRSLIRVVRGIGYVIDKP